MASSISLENRIGVVFLLSILQFYLVNVSGSYLPFALFSILILCPDVLLKAKLIIKEKIVWLLVALTVIQLISLFWSADIQLGLKSIIYNAYFILLFGAVLIADQRKLVSSILNKAVLFALLILAGAILFFRIFPELEVAFIKNKLSGFLINPNIQEGLEAGNIKNNVLDPRKAGAIFINANVAGCYLAMVAFFLLGVIKKQKLSMLAFFVFMFVAYATGSKTVLLISLFAAFLVVLISCTFKSKKYFKQSTFIGGAALVCALLFYSPIADNLNKYITIYKHNLNQSSVTIPDKRTINDGQDDNLEREDAEELELRDQTRGALGSRILLWQYAFQNFDEHPVSGQGFGGWQKGLPNYVQDLGEVDFDVKADFPPHNTFIYLWSQSGVFAVIVALFLIIWLVFISTKLAILSKNDQQSQMVVGLTMVWVWLTLHGMGDNTGLLGEVHQIAILAISVGMLSRAYNVKSRGLE